MIDSTHGLPLLRRAATEHRRLVMALAIALGVNVILYAVVVYPLSQRVANIEQRNQAAERALAEARAEHAQATGTLTGKARASAELTTFYKDVLPQDLAGARRMTYLRLARLAREANLEYDRSSYDPVADSNSTLTRLQIQMVLSGTYAEMRDFIYRLETSPEFVGLGLSGAVGVVVVAAVMGRVGTDQSSTIATQARRANASATSRAQLVVDDVRLELLQQERAGRKSAQRNPFRFEARAAAPSAAGRPAGARPTSTMPPVAGPTGPPPLPPIPLRFIGLVDAPTQAGRLAILSDGRGNIFYGKDGAIIEGRYKVLKVSPEAAELSYLDGRGRQTIRLTGQ